jgi:hypothetical protein
MLRLRLLLKAGRREGVVLLSVVGEVAGSALAVSAAV